MRKRSLFLFIIIIILSLVILTCHVHYHGYGGGNDAHCPFCSLLNMGFILAVPFKFFLDYVAFITFAFKTKINPDAVKIFNNRLRAPPFLAEHIKSLKFKN